MYKEPVMWKMRNGQTISVDDMSEEHAKNTLKMLIRNIERAERAKVAKRESFSFNGDIAQSSFDQCETDRMDPNPGQPW